MRIRRGSESTMVVDDRCVSLFRFVDYIGARHINHSYMSSCLCKPVLESSSGNCHKVVIACQICVGVRSTGSC